MFEKLTRSLFQELLHSCKCVQQLTGLDLFRGTRRTDLESLVQTGTINSRLNVNSSRVTDREHANTNNAFYALPIRQTKQPWFTTNFDPTKTTILTCTLQTKRQRLSFHLRFRKMNESTSSYLHIDLKTIYFIKRSLPLLVYITWSSQRAYA